jgi:hypothetical protein
VLRRGVCPSPPQASRPAVFEFLLFLGSHALSLSQDRTDSRQCSVLTAVSGRRVTRSCRATPIASVRRRRFCVRGRRGSPHSSERSGRTVTSFPDASRLWKVIGTLLLCAGIAGHRCRHASCADGSEQPKSRCERGVGRASPDCAHGHLAAHHQRHGRASEAALTAGMSGRQPRLRRISSQTASATTAAKTKSSPKPTSNMAKPYGSVSHIGAY